VKKRAPGIAVTGYTTIGRETEGHHLAVERRRIGAISPAEVGEIRVTPAPETHAPSRIRRREQYPFGVVLLYIGRQASVVVDFEQGEVVGNAGHEETGILVEDRIFVEFETRPVFVEVSERLNVF